MVDSFEQYLEETKQTIENHLNNSIESINAPKELKDSMLYSLMAGGKRLRPILLLLSYQSYKSESEKVITSAIALEIINSYSLIHDDLPAMDNDDLRRGKKTNHKKFDEATAILAGDALLTYSFEIIANDPLLSDSEKVKTVQLLSKSSGPAGMVGGESYDRRAEQDEATLNDLERIR